MFKSMINSWYVDRAFHRGHVLRYLFYVYTHGTVVTRMYDYFIHMVLE